MNQVVSATVGLPAIVVPDMDAVLQLIINLQPHVDAALSLAEQAERAVIDNDEQFTKGTEFLTHCDVQFKQVEKLRTDVKRPLDELIQVIQQHCTTPQKAMKAAAAAMQAKMREYDTARRKRQQEEEAARRRAQEQAAQRLAEEQEKKGNIKAAEAILEAATAPPPERKAPKSTTNSMGRSTHTVARWVGEVAKPMVVLQAIVDGKIPISPIEWKPSELNKIAAGVGVEGEWLGIKVSKDEKFQQR